MIQAAALYLNDSVIGAGTGIGHIAQFEFARRTMGDELEGFHSASLGSEGQ